MLARRTMRVSRPFSLRATVLSHGWHECAPASWCDATGCFQTIERVDGRLYRASLVEAGRSAKTVTLRLTVRGDDPTSAIVSTLALRLRGSLKLDHDLGEFHALCHDHPLLGDIPSIGAGRLLHSHSMTENIIKAICATNVNWTQAVKMINRLAQAGPHIPHFRSQNAWPTPREILRAGEPYLKDICRVGYRSDSILALCDDVAAGRFDPDGLVAMGADAQVPTEDILAILRGIRGVGPATAHFLLTCVGRYDRVSIDSATVDHVRRVHRPGRKGKPTNRDIERIYAPYGRWRNLVYWFENWIQWETAREMVDRPPRRRPDRRPGGPPPESGP